MFGPARSGTEGAEGVARNIMLLEGVVSEAQLREEMRQNHIRHDALEMAERTPPLAA